MHSVRLPLKYSSQYDVRIMHSSATRRIRGRAQKFKAEPLVKTDSDIIR